MPHHPPSNAGALVGESLGKYELLALLALGGTAEIYLARIGGAAGFEKYVVVKCLHDHLADDAEFVRMFLDEARLGAQLDHSNIVQTLELGEHKGRYYMVMEYLAGMSLALVARKAAERVPGGRIPDNLVLGLAAQACSGLHYAHERSTGGTFLKIVHRDVSPQNLVISFEGDLKIVDFGIAKAELRETHTQSGTIKGKFAYMSPEQCLAQDVDRRTDVFALGTIVHELLTGRRLFKRSSTYDTYHAILDGNVPTPSSVNHELDPALDEVVMRALAYNREDRYPTAEAFGEALMTILHRRGKSASAGDVSRFFDQFFQKEIDEHGQRMRELIEGRRSTIDDLQWDAPDPDSDVAAVMPDDRPETLDDPLPSGGGSEEEGGEATRIELNPLERAQELHAELEKIRAQNQKVLAAEDGGAAAAATPQPRKTLGYGVPQGLLPPSEPSGKAKQTSDAPPTASMRPVHKESPPLASGESEPTVGVLPGQDARGAPPPAYPRAPSAERPSTAGESEPTVGVLPGQDARGTPPPPAQQAAAPQDRTMLATEQPPDVKAALEAIQQGQDPHTPPPQQQHTPPPQQQHTPPPQQQHTPPPQQQHTPPPQRQQPPAGPSADPRFPPINTPTAFRARAEMIQGGPDTGQQSPVPEMSDLARLAGERSSGERATPPWLLGLAFLLAVGLGLGITVLVGALVG